ncbi:MAG TPA: hypothetical protein VLG16_05025 [Candidatus Saccharimonadales bacterium]|nr:hypothetical protein [Candidatus Saccharimonadales bacterium]
MDNNIFQPSQPTNAQNTPVSDDPPADGSTGAPVQPGVSPLAQPLQPAPPTSDFNTPLNTQSHVSFHEPQKPKKTPWKLIILVAVIVVAAALSVWAYVYYHHKTVKKSTTTTINKNKPAVVTPHTPTVTTNGTASLGLGTYHVGADKDIAPGIYAMSPGPQETGQIAITNATTAYNATLNALEDTHPEQKGTTIAWATLSDGDTVQITGANLKNVTFKPVVTSPGDAAPLTKLYTDNIPVSTTIPNSMKPGKYFMYDTDDKGAFILIVGSDYHIKYNEPLNSTGFVADLADGDQMAAVNMSKLLVQPR